MSSRDLRSSLNLSLSSSLRKKLAFALALALERLLCVVRDVLAPHGTRRASLHQSWSAQRLVFTLFCSEQLCASCSVQAKREQWSSGTNERPLTPGVLCSRPAPRPSALLIN